MPSRITVRFFRVTAPDTSKRKFTAALKDIDDQPLDARKRELDGTGFRLERYEVRRGLHIGEMTRIQDDNLPAEVTPEGLSELDVDELGFGCTFVYDADLGVMALQYDPRLVSMGRISQYLQEHDERNKFFFSAMIAPDSWEQFADGAVTSFKVKVAVPQNLNLANDDTGDIGRSIKKMSRLYDAPYVTVTLGVGNRGTTLSDLVKNTAKQLAKLDNVESLRAKVVGSVDEIDLLSGMLRERDVIRIPSDPVESFRARSNFVAEAYRRNYDYISRYVSEE